VGENVIQVAHWNLVKPADWRWPNFTPQELACRADQSLTLDEEFMDALERLRQACGFPLLSNSCYRSEAYNETLKDSVAHDAHTQGKAIDLRCFGEQAHTILRYAGRCGFVGIGVKQAGAYEGRFLHLDTAPSQPTAPRPGVWSYNAVNP
jgi:zinc D-Ala-D-Ala carboxypeptidase